MIHTEKLILRLPEQKDIADIVEGLNNLNVSGTYGAVSYPYTEEHARKWITKCAESAESAESGKEMYPYSLELKAEKKVIGGSLLNHVSHFHGTASLGYWINEKYWQQGLITEAILKTIHIGFTDLNLRRIYLYAYADNEPSNRVAEKMGFKLEGTLKQSHKSKATNKVHDANVYGLLKEDWIILNSL